MIRKILQKFHQIFLAHLLIQWDMKNDFSKSAPINNVFFFIFFSDGTITKSGKNDILGANYRTTPLPVYINKPIYPIVFFSYVEQDIL